MIPPGEASTIENPRPGGLSDPSEMVWIPGGEFSMGATVETGRSCTLGSGREVTADALPVHRVRINGFWFDRHEVTNAEFERFVRETGYVTVAERRPTEEELPGVPDRDRVAGSLVFSPPPSAIPLSNPYAWWRFVRGANWRHPSGPKSTIKGKENHPVVQIAYEDAAAYARWAGKRLPTEAEFEFAARGGLSGALYPWGNEFNPGGTFMANTFQGSFPWRNTGEDGFLGTAPVMSFPANGYGVFDVAGNVWEWVSDRYRPDYYAAVSSGGTPVENPQGPDSSWDPSEPGEEKRGQRGGSFLCSDQYCTRYMVGTRGRGEISTATNHLGFRCAKDRP